MAAVKSADTQRFSIDQLQVVDPATTLLLGKYFDKVLFSKQDFQYLSSSQKEALLLFLKVKQQKNEENMSYILRQMGKRVKCGKTSVVQ